MELEGHPTHDLIEELERRGALRVEGSTAGPDPETIRFVHERTGDIPGAWLFLPSQVYATGFDELPPP